ncbi:IS30 family transposase, partial [Marinomonas sp. NPDC078689]
RQYVPKGIDLRSVTEEKIDFAMRRINNRPRKYLGFKQPAVIFKLMCLAA